MNNDRRWNARHMDLVLFKMLYCCQFTGAMTYQRKENCDPNSFFWILNVGWSNVTSNIRFVYHLTTKTVAIAKISVCVCVCVPMNGWYSTFSAVLPTSNDGHFRLRASNNLFLFLFLLSQRYHFSEKLNFLHSKAFILTEKYVKRFNPCLPRISIEAMYLHRSMYNLKKYVTLFLPS